MSKPKRTCPHCQGTNGHKKQGEAFKQFSYGGSLYKWFRFLCACGGTFTFRETRKARRKVA